MSQKSIQLELFTNLDHNKTFTIQDAYESVSSTDKKHSIRARIYEAINKGIFEKVSRGVYRFFVTTNELDWEAEEDEIVEAWIEENIHE